MNTLPELGTSVISSKKGSRAHLTPHRTALGGKRTGVEEEKGASLYRSGWGLWETSVLYSPSS